MVVRGSCMSDRMPSCMRAPPEAANSTNGAGASTAARMAVMIASPAAMPSEPPMKAKSWTATTTRHAVEEAVGGDDRIIGAGLLPSPP